MTESTPPPSSGRPQDPGSGTPSPQGSVGEPGRPAPPRGGGTGPPGGAPRPPAPPPAGLLHPQETPLMEYLKRRMEMIERELLTERERARAAESLLQQQQALRGEVETQLKSITEQIKREKGLKELEDERTLSRGRVEALERRLDEMHETWAGLLKDAISRRETASEASTARLETLTESLAEVRRELARLREGLTPVPTLASEAQELRDLLPADARRRGEEAALLREHLSAALERFGQSIEERLAGIDRRMGGALSETEARLETLGRERATLAEMLDEERHRIRAEFAKDRAELERELHSRLEELRAGLGDLSGRQEAAAGAVTALQELLHKVHAALSAPKASDIVREELEGEKAELMKALKERTEQLRAYAEERREIERSLGESLLDMSRELQAERARHQETRQRLQGVELGVEGLKAEAELKKREIEASARRQLDVLGERDEIVKALTLEAEKVRAQIAARAESERLWDEKLRALQAAVEAARRQKAESEQAAAGVKGQVEELTSHLTRLLREKEAVEQGAVRWQHEQAELMAQLRKKDEMISMLSATFQNLLKKPS